MRFKDKVALVTGASRGIGRTIVLELAKEGAKIIADYHISDYEPDASSNIKKVMMEIKKIGVEAISIECDVSDEEQVKNMVKKSMEKFGKIDILVNNAGVVYDTPFFEKSTKEWKRTIDVNLSGTYFCSKYVALEMKKHKTKGAIINISSTNAINCFNPNSIDYDASKTGIIILTKDLALELAPNVRVNVVAPGWVDTEMNKDLSKDFIIGETKKIYMKRFAQPEEIAKVVSFLASDDASFVNGAVLNVDGGHS